MVQQQRERIAPALGERSDEDLEEGNAVVKVKNFSKEDEAVVGGAGEGQMTPSEGDATVKDRASDELRTAMEAMKVGE